MLKGGSILKLQDLQLEGKALREATRITGFSRNTVRKYIRDGWSLEWSPHPKKGSKLEPYKSTIDIWMKDGLFNCRVILRRLQEIGYSGGITIVKDYVQEFRPPKSQKATVRYETKPGEQAQIDWGIGEYEDAQGVGRKIPVFVMILGHSGVIYIKITK